MGLDVIICSSIRRTISSTDSAEAPHVPTRSPHRSHGRHQGHIPPPESEANRSGGVYGSVAQLSRGVNRACARLAGRRMLVLRITPVHCARRLLAVQGTAPGGRRAGGGAGVPGQPRPTNGIVVAMTVRERMLVSSGRLAMWTTALATWSGSISGSGTIVPFAWS